MTPATRTTVRAPAAQAAPQETLRRALALALEEVRRDTHRLAAGVPDERFQAQVEAVVSPPAWDLGHIAWFEDQWLVAALGQPPVHGPEAATLYDADRNPRPERGGLDLPDRAAVLRRQAEVRAAALHALEGLDLDGKDPLTRGGFVHRMIQNHEAQHQENLLHGLARMEAYAAPRLGPLPEPRAAVEGMVRIPGGPFPMGADLAPGVYDNEAPAHEVDVPEFWLDAAPVTNAQFLRFVEAGGYAEQAHWSEDGWLLREALGWQHPWGWERRGQGWVRRAFDRVAPLDPRQPVVHVSWYEADAYARWAGKRLPTEAEWEKAATWDHEAQAKRAWPWGDAPWEPHRANLGGRLFDPALVGAFPEGATPHGVHQLSGDVWEWTSSELRPYPGFRAYPYDAYSVPWMQGGWFVLRGGSWASRAHLARPTFRNWGQPDHRQLFAGFRCASSAAPRGA
jgi:gamma-glutamyl hercynylcysteine S-oxide synthase